MGRVVGRLGRVGNCAVRLSRWFRLRGRSYVFCRRWSLLFRFIRVVHVHVLSNDTLEGVEEVVHTRRARRGAVRVWGVDNNRWALGRTPDVDLTGRARMYDSRAAGDLDLDIMQEVARLGEEAFALLVEWARPGYMQLVQVRRLRRGKRTLHAPRRLKCGHSNAWTAAPAHR